VDFDGVVDAVVIGGEFNTAVAENEYSMDDSMDDGDDDEDLG
jgi:hypothetical protein